MELDEVWTPGITMLMLRNIVLRYEAQKKRSKKKDAVELTEDSIMGSEWEKG